MSGITVGAAVCPQCGADAVYETNGVREAKFRGSMGIMRYAPWVFYGFAAIMALVSLSNFINAVPKSQFWSGVMATVLLVVFGWMVKLVFNNVSERVVSGDRVTFVKR